MDTNLTNNINLITFDYIQQYNKISDISLSAFYNSLISSASRFCNHQTNRCLAENELEGYYFNHNNFYNSFNLFNYNYFNTDNYPIQSVSAIYVRLTPFAEWTLVDSNDYEVRKEEGKIFLKNIFCWTELKTNYIAGYSLTAMPEDLQEACAKLVTDSFQKSGQNTKPQLGIKSMVNAGNTITFSDVSQEVLNTLDSYKRLII